MSDEEKQAIEYWKTHMEILHWNTQLASEHYMKILLNFIEKQQKEIEELKNADLTTVYLNGVYDGEKKVEDKIKAMLENEIINISGFECVAKEDVQSLLEKGDKQWKK